MVWNGFLTMLGSVLSLSRVESQQLLGKKEKQVSLPEDDLGKRVAIFNNSLPHVGATYLTKGHLW